MTHAVPIAVIMLLWLLLRSRRKHPVGHPPRPEFEGRMRQALALAQPYVISWKMSGFFNPDTHGFSDETPKLIRTQLLHHVELRTDADDETVAAHFARQYENGWYRADLRNLLPGDDPVAALAFACARVAFVARFAMMLGWIAEDAACRILLLNLQRAQDCFGSWETYGSAFLAGYRQWIGAMRADAFANHFDEASQALWFTTGTGAWRDYPWPGPAAFDPQPMQRRSS